MAKFALAAKAAALVFAGAALAACNTVDNPFSPHNPNVAPNYGNACAGHSNCKGMSSCKGMKGNTCKGNGCKGKGNSCKS